MYMEDYKRWLEADLEDPALKEELASIQGKEDEIKDRFAVALKFGTAGLRGVLGAGTNRMNMGKKSGGTLKNHYPKGLRKQY